MSKSLCEGQHQMSWVFDGTHDDRIQAISLLVVSIKKSYQASSDRSEDKSQKKC